MERTHKKSIPDDRFSFRDFMIAMALTWMVLCGAIYWIIGWLAS